MLRFSSQKLSLAIVRRKKKRCCVQVCGFANTCEWQEIWANAHETRESLYSSSSSV